MNIPCSSGILDLSFLIQAPGRNRLKQFQTVFVLLLSLFSLGPVFSKNFSIIIKHCNWRGGWCLPMGSPGSSEGKESA